MKKQKQIIDKIIDYSKSTVDSLIETGRDCEKKVRDQVHGGLNQLYHTLGLSSQEDLNELRKEIKPKTSKKKKK
ncbi:MAG: hypothetical protein K940chlam3_00698 [Chlamydiae bacterium]|nr:hypothetical protein [Chlamydiota bacterium]